MPYIPRCLSRPLLASLLALALPLPSWADGMIPETSVVIVKEEDGEASIKVRNSDGAAALLHVTLQDLPEDTEPLLFLSQPVWRVEAGKEQLVRFILRGDKPLTTQRLKRVIFEGIPHSADTKAQGLAKVGVSLRQNLPVIIHPKGLAPNRTPWTALRWQMAEGKLSVRNDSPYVVRLAQELKLLPSGQAARLARSYVLPGDTLEIAVDGGLQGTPEKVRLFPATVYGFAVDAHEAAVVAGGA
ncbi:fimbria/pilus chaperone family protein [Pseudomonas sp. zfem004]|uniref:fimbria/pilus chaperone family protein n=1 Tax=Pseudomonas sp. zfem004 TaxID=3078199 RepID=UPI002928DAA2|nr:fimbria/pilus chaperone family protein [Pseudomonas sp. zfem004]MDU9402463.1 fimbria/pilus chaperone family protein [Pseudomonas sp. zfem004]